MKMFMVWKIEKILNLLITYQNQMILWFLTLQGLGGGVVVFTGDSFLPGGCHVCQFI